MSFRRCGVAVAVLAALASAAVRAEDGGGLVGWVESTRGAPVAGAVISVFGSGIRGGSLLTLSDSEGQFILPSLPAGSYTLRALGTGHLPSAAGRVTVLPNRDALFTLSLTPVGEATDEEPTEADEPEAKNLDLSEWQWLMRHKRRSVLETAAHDGPVPEDATAPTMLTPSAPRLASIDPMGGRVELMTRSNRADTTTIEPGGLPTGMGTLQLQGRLGNGVHWSVGGLLTESESRSWRTAAEFVLEPGGGHEIQTGAGYGAGYTRALLPAESTQTGGDRAVGAFFVKDRWRVGKRLTTTFGTRYTYIGFLSDSHHADAVVEVEVRGGPKTLVHGSVATRTLAPGGDLLTLSSVSSASPAITWADMDGGLRPSRTLRMDLGVDRSFRSGGRVGAFAFRENARDQLWTTFGDGNGLRVRNAGTVRAQGLGITAGHEFGSLVKGSVTYTFGRGSRMSPAAFRVSSATPGLEDARFHDVVARLETFIGWSNTRVAALYRVNVLSDEEDRASPSLEGQATTRFDVQVTQRLPFLEPLTSADWDLLVAVSNLFYEGSEGGFLDELAVQEPPTRVVGGISVRF